MIAVLWHMLSGACLFQGVSLLLAGAYEMHTGALAASCFFLQVSMVFDLTGRVEEEDESEEDGPALVSWLILNGFCFTLFIATNLVESL